MSKVNFSSLPPLPEAAKKQKHNPSPFPLPKNLQSQPSNPKSSDSSSKNTNTPNYGLHHLQNHWPGETGNGQRHLDVVPGMSLFDLLSPNKNNNATRKIVIPLFQRRYCWTLVQIEKWFHDVHRATQSHATHKAMFKRHVTQNKKEQLLCLDGQQRITTTTLLLAAIRPYCRKSKMDATMTKIDDLLFGSDSGKIHQWARTQAKSILRQNRNKPTSETAMVEWTLPSFPVGWIPKSAEFRTTLVPSYIDRAAYFEILCFDLIQQALEHLGTEEEKGGELLTPKISLHFSESTETSTQCMAYSMFSQWTQKLLKPAADGNADYNAKILSKLYSNQLHRFSMTYIELLTKNDNLQQIFLWMQEKSVFGSGRLLFNPHPGIDFAPVDLARNLIVSSVMDLPLEQQVEAYTRCWIHPLEGRCKDTNALGDVLLHLVTRVDQEKGKDRHVGSMEEKLNYYRSVVPPALQSNFTNDMPMMVYGRFHSFVQSKAIELGSNPNVVSHELANVIVQEMVQEGEAMGVLL